MATKLSLPIAVIECANGFGRLSAEKCVQWFRSSNGEAVSAWHKRGPCVECKDGATRSAAAPATPIPEPVGVPTPTRKGVGTGNAKVDKTCNRCKQLMVQVHPARKHHITCSTQLPFVGDPKIVLLREIIAESKLGQGAWADTHRVDKPALSKLLNGKANVPLELAFALQDASGGRLAARDWVGYDFRKFAVHDEPA